MQPEPVTADFPYELVLGDIVISRPEYNFYFTDFMHRRHQYYQWEHGIDEPFDLSVPLEYQMHRDGIQTWADYIHGLIEAEIRQYAQALEAGTVLSQQDMDFINDNAQWIEEEAAFEGVSVDEYISGFFDGMTMELFLRHLERDMLVNAWRTAEMENITFTQDELIAFYYENWQEIDPWNDGVRSTDASLVDTRHILVSFPSDEPTASEIEETRLAAEALFAEWYEGVATEESFAALATERTDDHGSAAMGGLYSNIFPGQMVPAFDAWIFYENRQHGDTGIVETNFGFHIMYFVRQRIDWEQKAETAMTEKAFEEKVAELAGKFTVERRIS